MADSCIHESVDSTNNGDRHTGMQNVNSDFVCLGRCDLNRLDFEWLSCSPAYGGLASDGLSYGV